MKINHFSETLEQVEKIVKHYTNCILTKPKKDYGLAFKLTGPSGELWDIVEGTQHYKLVLVELDFTKKLSKIEI